MDKKEAIVRYAMEHGMLDDLKITLLNQSISNNVLQLRKNGEKKSCIIPKMDTVKLYFKEHKRNIKLTINNLYWSRCFQWSFLRVI